MCASRLSHNLGCIFVQTDWFAKDSHCIFSNIGLHAWDTLLSIEVDWCLLLFCRSFITLFYSFQNKLLVFSIPRTLQFKANPWYGYCKDVFFLIFILTCYSLIIPSFIIQLLQDLNYFYFSLVYKDFDFLKFKKILIKIFNALSLLLMVLVFKFFASCIDENVPYSLWHYFVLVRQQYWLNCIASDHFKISVLADQVLESKGQFDGHCVSVAFCP